MVAGIGDQSLAKGRQGNFVYIACWKCRVQPVLRVLIRDVIVCLEKLGEEIVFIVAVPYNNGRVMTQTRNVVFHLSGDILYKALMCRVCSASEQKVLPNEEAELVANIIEYIFFEDAPCPDAIQSKTVSTRSATSL